MSRARPPRPSPFPPLLIPLLLVFAGCEISNTTNPNGIRIGAYSVVREVLHEGVLPAFNAKWKARTGRDVDFEESYSSSGAQARSIAAGFDADVAILSHSGDMELLVKAGKVRADWNEGEHRGVLTNSLVVIGHREGNPKSIHDWADLAKPDVGVLYPDPKTSGGARWNINAIYGAAVLEAREKDQDRPDLGPARELLTRIQANVVNMDQSGRQSMANFSERDTGDAVVTYENELLLRAREADPIPYVVPSSTLLIESPAAIVDGSVASHGNAELASAFMEFLHSAEAQSIFAEYGFRPTNREAAASAPARPEPARVFTMAELGGWKELEKTLYASGGLWTTIAAERARNRGN